MMTRDQKTLLRALGVFITFKALLYLSIRQAAKTVREANIRYEVVPGSTGQFLKYSGTDTVSGHVKLRDEE